MLLKNLLKVILLLPIKSFTFLVSKFLIFLIYLYQVFLSPYLGSNCRFTPTCSNYAKQSIQKHGVFTGVFLAAKRILKCNPYGGVGLDPVPNKVTYKREKNNV